MWHRVVNNQVVESVSDLPVNPLLGGVASAGWCRGLQSPQPAYNSDVESLRPVLVYDRFSGIVTEGWAVEALSVHIIAGAARKRRLLEKAAKDNPVLAELLKLEK